MLIHLDFAFYIQRQQLSAHASCPLGGCRWAATFSMEVDGEVANQRGQRPPPLPFGVRKKHRGTLGPVDFAGVARWPRRVVDSIANSSEDMLSTMKDHMVGMVITTHYSGMGCVETAIPMLAHAVFGDNPEDRRAESVRVYSACEVDPVARAMILSHKHAPEHCFGDILDRVPPEQLRELKDIETKALQAARQVKHDAKEAGKEVQDVGLQTAKSDLGKEYHAGARGCQPDQCKNLTQSSHRKPARTTLWLSFQRFRNGVQNFGSRRQSMLFFVRPCVRPLLILSSPTPFPCHLSLQPHPTSDYVGHCRHASVELVNY
jgi:hypothetical protein